MISSKYCPLCDPCFLEAFAAHLRGTGDLLVISNICRRFSNVLSHSVDFSKCSSYQDPNVFVTHTVANS